MAHSEGELQPLVSVVIPAHNEARWLPGCLKSLAEQSYIRKEIIVVDDGSADETSAIALSLGAKVIRHDIPLGEPRSRNDGIKAASGEFVAELDADAVYPVDFLEIAVRYFQSDPEIDGLIRGYLLVLPERKGLIADFWRFKRAASYYLKLRGEKNAEYGCQVGKKSVLETLGGYDETLPIGNDVDLGKRMDKAGFKLVWAKELFFWHADPATLRHTLKRIWAQSTLGKSMALRWHLWPSGWRLGIFLVRNLFITLLPIYLVLALVDGERTRWWIALAILAFSVESIMPVIFHQETRTIFLLALKEKKWALAFTLPFLLFFQLRTSAYAKLYAFLKEPPRYYRTDY